MRIKNLKGYLCLALAAAVTTPGCVPKSDCQIVGYHLHKYESPEGIVRYTNSENQNDWGFYWTDKVIYPDSAEEMLRKAERSNSMYRIEDNIEYIKKMEDANPSYYVLYEYEVSSSYLQPMFLDDDTIMWIPMPSVEYKWTMDPNHPDLTGKTKIMHTVYIAYYAEKTKDGTYVFKESPPLDSLLDSGYMYFSSKSKREVEDKQKTYINK